MLAGCALPLTVAASCAPVVADEARDGLTGATGSRGGGAELTADCLRTTGATTGAVEVVVTVGAGVGATGLSVVVVVAVAVGAVVVASVVVVPAAAAAASLALFSFLIRSMSSSVMGRKAGVLEGLGAGLGAGGGVSFFLGRNNSSSLSFKNR